MKLYCLLILVLIIPGSDCRSQVTLPSFTAVRGTGNYTLGKVVSLAQDKHGYMWFADQTNNCLVRYDGFRMKIYRNDPSDTNSLATNVLECMTADSAGNIWIAVPHGVDRYDDGTGKFIHYRYPANEKDRYFNVILVDHAGMVWIGTASGLDRLDPSTGKFIHYVHDEKDPSSISCDMVRSLYEDRSGTLWAGTGLAFDTKTTDGGLNRFNRKAGNFTRYLHNAADPRSLISNKVRAICEDSKGNFWVGTDGDGLHLMNRAEGIFQRLTYDPAHPEKLSRPPVNKTQPFDLITFIEEDAQGKLWIGTYSAGIVVYDPRTKKLNHFDNSDKNRPGGYTDNSTWASIITKDRTIWISNENSELFRVDPYQAGFSEVRLNTLIIHFLEDPDKSLWLSTGGEGLLKFNPVTGEKKYARHDPADSTTISSNEGTDIKRRTDGQWWVGSWNGGNIFNPLTGTFKRFFYNGDTSHNPIGVYAVLDIGQHTYFGLSNFNFWIQDKITGKIEKYQHNPYDTTSLGGGPNGSAGAIVDLKENKDGAIWISVWASDGGSLDLFNPRTKQFKHYLKGLTVGDLLNTSDGKLWVATSKGLYYRDDLQDTFLPAGENSPLSISRVRSLLEDDEKNIWGVAGVGIFRYNPRTNQINIYGDRFGVSDVRAQAYAGCFKTAEGKLLFGNPHGYYSCIPGEVVNPVAPQIIFSDFKIDGRSVQGNQAILKGTAIEDAGEIRLAYNQNIFSIDFSSTHFADPDNNRLAYMLENYDRDWREAGSDKAAYYANLPVGDYNFRIKAISSYGAGTEKNIRIIILPPWWQTWWFRTLIAIFILAAIYSYVQYRSLSLKKQNLLLEKKVEQRTTELNNSLAELKTAQDQLIQSEKMASLGELTAGIAHEIKNPLNFIANFSEINLEIIGEMNEDAETAPGTMASERTNALVKTLQKNLEKINHHAKRIDGIVKGMLHHSRASNLTKEPTNINTLCDESLKLAYHGFRAKEKGFNVIMRTDFEENLPKLMVIPQDFGRVILNLLNNAFYAVHEKKKITHAGLAVDELEGAYKPEVTVSTKRIADKVRITIADNGTGISAAVINKIFQPFYTTKPTGEGTGLGLSMSYDIIVKGHGGELKAKSKEGEGTEFEIILPFNSK